MIIFGNSFRSKYKQEKKQYESKKQSFCFHIAAGFYGSYYAIWYAVADKQNPKKSIPVLTNALQKLETDRVKANIQFNTPLPCYLLLCSLPRLPICRQATQAHSPFFLTKVHS
jgi:hypothetical protein